VELDHVFLIVQDEATARAMMRAAGLRVNYSRAHPGQGTRNICACLDDMFFELLWADGTDASEETGRIGLTARCGGAGSPIGLSWRGETDLPCDAYAAPFLPEGLSIPVAQMSRSLAAPFVFQTPGGTPPIDRTDGLTGTRQSPDIATLGALEIAVPALEAVAPLIGAFDRVSFVAGPPQITATLLAPNGTRAAEFTWIS